jgi:hypothetical protein
MQQKVNTKPVPVIHVGCRGFSLGRLQTLINSKRFEVVACVDVNVEMAQQGVRSLTGEVPGGLIERIFSSIT